MPANKTPISQLTVKQLTARPGKPHIRRWEPNRRDFYVCRGCGYVGIGYTARNAWEVWDFKFRNGGGCR